MLEPRRILLVALSAVLVTAPSTSAEESSPVPQSVRLMRAGGGVRVGESSSGGSVSTSTTGSC